MKNNNGFTLAEVLITLAIIGVVAAMTVPALMTSTRGKEFEVGANKALSTIANAMTMRLAMEGQTLPDFAGNRTGMQPLLDYLTVAPGDRPGEQPALPVVARNGGVSGVVKLKDGMILVNGFSCTQFGGNIAQDTPTAFIVLDTNGEKGPTRTTMDSSYGGGGVSCDFNNVSFNLNVRVATGNTITLVENTSTPADNNNPDLIAFAIDGHSGAVKPIGQRSRNILATGNAMISQ